MKTKQFIFVLLLMSSLQVPAQHPLVGTWEMVSLKGIGFDGKQIFLDTSMARETKIITPTHYMLIAHDIKGDSMIFNRAHAGTVKFDGDYYIESPQIASWDSLKPTSHTFNWKVEGDKFIQSGAIKRADGKTAVLEELIFQRVKGIKSYPNNPSIGTWDQLSSTFTLPDGKKGSHTRETATRFQIITDTHMMRISHRNNKFEGANGGAYTMEGNTIYATIEVASFPFDKNDRFMLSQRVQGDKLHSTGKAIFENGKTMTWQDVFQKVQSDVPK